MPAAGSTGKTIKTVTAVAKTIPPIQITRWSNGLASGIGAAAPCPVRAPESGTGQ